VHVRRLGAVRALHVAADFDLEHLERRAKGGPEEVVEDLSALRLGLRGGVGGSAVERARQTAAARAPLT